MSASQVIEMVDNTWPALQRAESIFGPRDESNFRGAQVASKIASPYAKQKRSM